MELAPFGSLLDCLQERRLRALLHPGVLCSLAQQLAEAMSYLENRSQPHGHLSASRVLVFALDRVKLVHPAGLNSGWDEKSPGTFLSRHEVWPAPETSQGGGSPSISADVWSFGVTLWEMFSYGRRPSPLSDYASQLPACPDACPARLYRDVMLSRCWQLEPTRRASFSQLALHLPKILPERRIATRNQPKLLPNDLELHLGDVIVVLDDDRNSDDGYQRCFGARIPSEEFEIDDKDLGNDVIAVGRFNWSTTAPLDPGAATTPATKGTLSSRVTRRATLSSSYAREFGQKISRFKKAAQSRLLHQSPLTPGSSDLRLEQHQQDAEAPASDLLCPHPRRRRVTSDMISEPTRTEFRHAGHVGADGTVFGDVSCLAELELTPTCEPPPPQQQQLAEEVAADASDSASSIVYRRR
uniref:CRIB domain-containing protein n=3 Tax=Macrostomum lignano TaxID=282301 RepID=A0A1I8GI67_9PLAT